MLWTALSPSLVSKSVAFVFFYLVANLEGGQHGKLNTQLVLDGAIAVAYRYPVMAQSRAERSYTRWRAVRHCVRHTVGKR